MFGLIDEELGLGSGSGVRVRVRGGGYVPAAIPPS